MRTGTVVLIGGLIGAAAFVLFVPTWEPLPGPAAELAFPNSIQFTPVAASADENKAPPSLPPVADGGTMATAAYRNVRVLTDVSAAEFMRLQQALTQWVSPKQGCGFCHVGEDYASDANSRKAAARIMLQMTRHLNTDWTSHVQPSGITCYSCHRGQPVPPETWFPDAPAPVRAHFGKEDNWQENADTVRKFFPDAGWGEYFLQDEPIAVSSTDALPNGTLHSWPEAIRVYEMMMQMSDGIGVNCGFCHSSRNFASWAESTPYRWVGYDAIRLTRDLNVNYLVQLAAAVPQTRQQVHETGLPVLPAQQRGEQAGNGFVVCKTCHYGLPKPLNGAAMLQDYPGLTGPRAQPTKG